MRTRAADHAKASSSTSPRTCSTVVIVAMVGEVTIITTNIYVELDLS